MAAASDGAQRGKPLCPINKQAQSVVPRALGEVCGRPVDRRGKLLRQQGNYELPMNWARWACRPGVVSAGRDAAGVRKFDAEAATFAFGAGGQGEVGAVTFGDFTYDGEADAAGFQFGRAGLVAATDQRAQACHQFGQLEGLVEVIVGAEVETADAVFEAVAGGQDQHRCAAAAPPQASSLSCKARTEARRSRASMIVPLPAITMPTRLLFGSLFFCATQ